MSRTRRHRKRQGFKKRNVNCSLCPFEESCNLKDAKICHGFVLKDTKPIVTNADTKITNVDKENQVEQLPMYDPEYTAPVSMSECLAMFLFIILLFIGCAYLILR